MKQLNFDPKSVIILEWSSLDLEAIALLSSPSEDEFPLRPTLKHVFLRIDKSCVGHRSGDRVNPQIPIPHLEPGKDKIKLTNDQSDFAPGNSLNSRKNRNQKSSVGSRLGVLLLGNHSGSATVGRLVNLGCRKSH